MTAHQSTGVAVIRRTTQDGYDWPNGVQDERWPTGQALPAKSDAEGAKGLLRPRRPLAELDDLTARVATRISLMNWRVW